MELRTFDCYCTVRLICAPSTPVCVRWQDDAWSDFDSEVNVVLLLNVRVFVSMLAR